MDNITHRLVTNDGSETFYNERFKQHYHAPSGAVEEAFEKHARPGNVEVFAKKGKIVIVDYCFGMGYNAAAAIDLALKTNPKCKIIIYALEIDGKIIKRLKDVNPAFESWQIIIESAKSWGYKKDNIEIIYLIGDARRQIKNVKEKVDVVFFDPFSKSVCPWLWTKKVFSDLYKIMNKNGHLTTYSCARSVRDNMKTAGFEVMNGPVIGRRGPATIAIKK